MCSSAIPICAGGLSKKSTGDRFLPCAGFYIVDCAWQDETQLPTWIMSWRWFKRCKCQFRTVVFFQPCHAVLPAQPFPSRELGRSLVSSSLRRFYKCRQRLNPNPAMRFVNTNHARFNSLANDRAGKNCPREFHSRTVSPSCMPRVWDRQDEW